MPTKPTGRGRKKGVRGDPANVAVFNGIVERMRMVQRMAGIQYGGKRDIFQTAGYVPQGQETFAHYWALYKRGDVAGRIVDMPAKTTWRTPPEIVEEGKEDGTKFTKAANDLCKRVKFWSYAHRVDKLAGVGRYAIVMLGTRGVNDAELKMPLTKLASPEDLIYLSVYREDHADIHEWETNPGEPRFGLPKIYKLRTSSDVKSFQGTELFVHASRILHIAENVLEDEVFGTPRLERCLNRLFDLDKVAASTGEAYWQLVARILQAKINPEMEIDSETLKQIDEQMVEMIHDLRRQFSGQGVELGWLQAETPNVQQVADFYFSLLAGASGIPKRILFGSELGELASSQDQANYLGSINERQEQFAEPVILRPFIDRMIELGALPAAESKEYQINWPNLYEESDKDKAAASLDRARAAKELTPVGGNPRELVKIDAESNVWLVEREPDEEGKQVPPAIETPEVTEPGADGSDPEPKEPAAGEGVGAEDTKEEPSRTQEE